MPSSASASEPQRSLLDSAGPRTLLELLPGPVLQTDAMRSCVAVNAAWCAASGLTAEQAVGHGWRAAVHPDDVDALLAAWRGARSSPDPVPADHRVVRPDGTVVHLAGAVTALRDPVTGSLTGSIASWQDVTTRAVAMEEQRVVAETLQHGLLPETLPVIPGIALAARHRPAEGELSGDFYDAFPVGDDGWMLVIGDVCGKGPDAAVLTALARYTVRAEAPHDARPASVLAALNDAVLAQRGGSTFCTAACCLLRRTGTEVTATIAAGGHPLPLILREDGSVEQVGHAGALLGVLADADLRDQQAVLSTGDSLVLWTDGLTEAGAPYRLAGPADVAAMLARRRGAEPAPLIAGLEADALAGLPGPPRDDLAVVALRVGERPADPIGEPAGTGIGGPLRELPQVVSAWIAADGFSPLRARRAVRRLPTLHEPVRHAVLLLVDELVTAIVRQPGVDPASLIGLRVALQGGRVRVELNPPPSAGPEAADESEEALLRGALLRALVARSGVSTERGERRLWFEVDAQALAG